MSPLVDAVAELGAVAGTYTEGTGSWNGHGIWVNGPLVLVFDSASTLTDDLKNHSTSDFVWKIVDVSSVALAFAAAHEDDEFPPAFNTD